MSLSDHVWGFEPDAPSPASCRTRFLSMQAVAAGGPWSSSWGRGAEPGRSTQGPSIHPCWPPLTSWLGPVCAPTLVGQASMRLSLLLRRLESSRADRACVRLAFLSWHTKTTPPWPASPGPPPSTRQLQQDPSRLAEDEDESASDAEDDGDSVVGGPMATPPDGPRQGDGGSDAVLAGRLLLYARTFAEVSILTQ